MSVRKLDSSYSSYHLQIGAYEYAKRAATRNTTTTALLQQLGFSDQIGEIAKDRRKRILEYFEQLGQQIRRQAFIDLVSSFESDLFRTLGMATSKARHVLNQHYNAKYPFGSYRSDLARTAADFSNLGGYKRLLARTAASDVDPRRDLWEAISYRDFLVHGERWEFPFNPPTINFAYKILSSEIDRIEAQS